MKNHPSLEKDRRRNVALRPAHLRIISGALELGATSSSLPKNDAASPPPFVIAEAATAAAVVAAANVPRRNNNYFQTLTQSLVS
jgi:hypothetical protein